MATTFDAHPGWLGEARFAPVPRHRAVPRRPELIAALEPAGGIAATMLSAPAGYGKTLLLGEYHERRVADGAAAAWLTLEAVDADPGRFRQSLARAIGGHAPGIDGLDAVLGAALDGGGQLHLFLDNFEVVDESVADLLSGMVQALQGRVHWTIASRPGRLQPFARLRAQGIVQVVPAADLRFDRREVAALLGRRISPADRAPIDERLAGWPVAVQALRLELGREADLGAALSLVRGARGFVADYIAREAIAPLPDETAEFLRDVSIVAEIDATTADLIRGRSDSRRLLATLDLLDDLARELPNGRWRLHPLLREHLEHRFEQQGEGEVIARRMATARLLATRQDYVGAVRNTLLAGRPAEGAKLIDELGPVHLWCRFGINHTLEIMAPLPVVLAADYPAIRLREVLSLFKEGRTKAAINLIQEIQAAAAGLDEIALRKLEIEITCFEAIISITREVFSEETLDQVARLSLPNNGHVLDSLALVTTLIRIVAHQQWGEIDQADRMMPLAQQLGDRWPSSLNGYFLDIYRGWIAAARGRPKEAIPFYRRLPATEDKSRDELRCLGEVMTAEALYMLGDFKAAAAQIDLWLVPLGRSQAWFDFFAAAYVTAAHLALRREGLYGALAVVERLRILALDRDAPSLHRLIPPLKLSLLLRAGAWKEARAYEAEQQVGAACRALPATPRGTSWRERDLSLSAMAEFHIRAKEMPEARICIQRLEEDALEHGRAGVALTARLLRSVLVWGQGARGQAIILLAEVLEEAVVSGLRGLILERLPLIEPMLGPLVRAKALRTTAARRQLEVLVSAAARRAANRNHQLTSREQEILALVANGDTNKHIARRLAISENTVKFHLKRIALKVDAVGSGRASLAPAAQRLAAPL